MGIFFNKVEIFFPTKSVSLSTHFPHPCVRHAGCVKLFIEVSEHFTHAAFLLIVVCKTLFLEFILQGVKEMDFGGC